MSSQLFFREKDCLGSYNIVYLITGSRSGSCKAKIKAPTAIANGLAVKADDSYSSYAGSNPVSTVPCMH